jgi:hypothetical protein
MENEDGIIRFPYSGKSALFINLSSDKKVAS